MVFGFGIVLSHNLEVLHHRTLLKCLLNPILRPCGKVITSTVRTIKDRNQKIIGFKFDHYNFKNYDKKGVNHPSLFFNRKYLSSSAYFIIHNSKKRFFPVYEIELIKSCEE